MVTAYHVGPSAASVSVCLSVALIRNTDNSGRAPKNARSKRELKKREPLQHENPKTTLFLRGSQCSEVTQLLMKDLYTLKDPYALRFTKKNDGIHPFEDASSLEFFSSKNDTSLVLFGSHSKKRPHALTLVRMFEHKTLDMLELLLNPDTFRTLSQFKNKRKAGVGLKPLLAFQGTAFESPTPNAYTLAKSLLLDFFKGADVDSIDVEGLQYILSVSVGEEVVGQAAPVIRIRGFLISTKKSGAKLPKVELEEMGPRIDWRVGRFQQADPDVMKETLKKPRGNEVSFLASSYIISLLIIMQTRVKKNIETDLMGDKLGRIHVGKQDLSNLQARKFRGLKRAAGEDVDMDDVEAAASELSVNGDAKRTRV